MRGGKGCTELVLTGQYKPEPAHHVIHLKLCPPKVNSGCSSVLRFSVYFLLSTLLKIDFMVNMVPSFVFHYLFIKRKKKKGKPLEEERCRNNNL